jgi:periplasmic protein TonB
MFREAVAKRAALGVAILAAHVGLVALLAASGFVAPTLVQSMSVTFFQQEEARPNKPVFAEPTLRPVEQVIVPAPEVFVPVEPANSITSATDVEAEPAPVPAVAAPSSSAEAPSSTGGALPEMSDVAYMVQPTPHYPPESRRSREQGLVMLRVLIDESGHAKRIEIYRSSGHPRLDEAARAAVARAVFRPFKDGGVARSAAAIVPIEFSLRSSAS